MQRIAGHLLLLASLAPTLLSGLPVYHCRMTGIEGFACGCCPRTEVAGTETTPACCSRHEKPAPRETQLPEGPAPRLAPAASSGFCACCEVESDRYVFADPRERSAEELALRWSPAPLASPFDAADPLASPCRLRTPGRPELSPAVHPPLPLLHAALRC